MYVPATSRINVFIPIDPPPWIPDPTIYVPEACLIPDDGAEPKEDDWLPASWINGEVALLVGPGGTVTYPPGEYFAFARLTAGMEVPVMPSGRVRIGLG